MICLNSFVCETTSNESCGKKGSGGAAGGGEGLITVDGNEELWVVIVTGNPGEHM